MKTSRRNFLKTGALAAAGVAVMRQPVFASRIPPRMVGVQLYCIRDEMKTDPLGSLKQVADMGYVYLEHASYVDRKFYGWTAKEFKKVLDDLGLKMVSGHTVMGTNHWDKTGKDFTDAWKYTVEDAGVLEQKYVISPWMDESMRNTYDNLRYYLDVFNKCGEMCIKSGMKFGYHNHDFEFSQELNKEKVFDIMMKNIDPKLVVVQLDIGNMYIAGAKALDVVKQYPGRFENIHVKDMIKSTGGESEYESCILGEGLISCREVVDLATKIGGTTCYIIEQESYQGKAPLECIKQDLAIMKKWGY